MIKHSMSATLCNQTNSIYMFSRLSCVYSSLFFSSRCKSVHTSALSCTRVFFSLTFSPRATVTDECATDDVENARTRACASGFRADTAWCGVACARCAGVQSTPLCQHPRRLQSSLLGGSMRQRLRCIRSVWWQAVDSPRGLSAASDVCVPCRLMPCTLICGQRATKMSCDT